MRQLLAVSRSATTPPTIASSLAKPQPGSCEELDIPIAHLQTWPTAAGLRGGH